MKKLILTLGLLICTTHIVYGMDEAIKAGRWTDIAKDIKNNGLDMADCNRIIKADPSFLNAPNAKGLYLLPVLIYNTTNAPYDHCSAILGQLLENNGLNLTATNQHGNLLCNDASLEDEHKQRLVNILASKNIPNPFTQTNDPVNGITFNLKQPSRLALLSVTNYKLWLAAAAIAVAAVVIYKWYTKKASEENTEDAEDNENPEEITEQISH